MNNEIWSAYEGHVYMDFIFLEWHSVWCFKINRSDWHYDWLPWFWTRPLLAALTVFVLQVQWFWRALRSFDQKDRAQFLQFVTGTSKVPLQGFAFLEGMNGYQKFQIHRDDRSTDRLPVAHTWYDWIWFHNTSCIIMYMFYDVLAQYEWIILWSSLFDFNQQKVSKVSKKNPKKPQKDPVTLFH